MDLCRRLGGVSPSWEESLETHIYPHDQDACSSLYTSDGTAN